MKRNIGDTAVDPQTGWTWVCLGDRGPELGALWSVYGDRGQQYSAVEWDFVRPANDGLERALAAGVQNKAQGLLGLMGADIRARGDFWAGDDRRIWYDHVQRQYCAGSTLDCVKNDPEFASPSLTEVLEWGKLL